MGGAGDHPGLNIFFQSTKWMDDLRFFNVLLNIISVISGQWEIDNVNAVVACSRLGRFPPPAGLEPRNARSAGQRLAY